MKGFDLSDKELKSLLQDEGIESPSMGFNQSILSKIDAYEKSKIAPVKAPKWLIFGLMAFFISPAIYFLAIGSWEFNTLFTDVELPSLNFDLGINTTYLWAGFVTISVISMAIIFDRFLLNSNESSS